MSDSEKSIDTTENIQEGGKYRNTLLSTIPIDYNLVQELMRRQLVLEDKVVQLTIICGQLVDYLTNEQLIKFNKNNNNYQ